jgi:amino acid permease
MSLHGDNGYTDDRIDAAPPVDTTKAKHPESDDSHRSDLESSKDVPVPMSDTESAALIDYKTLTWWKGGIILIAETVSLGILSLPSVLATLGLVPGIILILVMSALSTYSCVVLGEFRRKYPFVQNFGDAVEVIGKSIGMGRPFQEIFGWAQVIFQVFVAGSHLLTWTICMNTLTNSSTCTIVWAVVGLGVFWVLNLPRTLKYTSWMSIASCLSIVVATLITVGDVGVSRPIGDGVIEVANKLGFSTAFLAVTNIAVSFSSHSCFFTVVGEFKEPSDWPKALALLQITDTTLYLVAAVVIYVYVGPNVPSPALSASDSFVLRKAIWGIAIPTIVIAGVIYGHVAASYIFGRIFRNTKHTVRRTKLSTAAWFGITFGIWLISLIIAESIPVFNSLLGLVAAVFVSWFSYGLPGIFWLWMHYGNWTNQGWKQTTRFVANVVLTLVGIMLCVCGLWASIEAIADEESTKPWTCASNAAS